MAETPAPSVISTPPVDTTSGKLLCISDFEGCAELGPPPAKQPQSRLLCTKEFFDSIITFLDSNPKNKVAFLGDYFDQGDLVVDTINNIIRVHEKFPNRVHIILGNRDLNKLRLIYEMREAPQVLDNEANGWSVWKGFYAEIASPLSLNARLSSILAKSMGAVVPTKIAQGLSPEDAAYVLVRAFSEPNAILLANSNSKNLDKTYGIFYKNVRTLFDVGKIVVHDTDFKTMLSHAGGSDPFMFHTDVYYQTITRTLRKEIKTGLSKEGEKPELSYYAKIEQVRRALQIPPNGIEEIATSFVANTYNTVLSSISTLFDSIDDPKPDYFLLQGLGLKPDAHPGTAVIDGKTFTSFIQSCDVQGCKGPHGPDINITTTPEYEEKYTNYFKTLVANDIHFIAHGHVPNCTPIPLIYKREGVDGLIFVDNDTSNGYRPAAIDSINKIPLAYISDDGKAGVFSLPGDRTNTYKGDAGVFAPMVGEWDTTNAPTFGNESKVITYVDGKKLSFPARAETTIPKIFSPAVMAGGKRRKNTHKIHNRRRGGATKKNRKSKRRVR